MKVSVVRSTTLVVFLLSYLSVSIWSGGQILADSSSVEQSSAQMTLALSYVDTGYKSAASMFH